MLHHSLPYPLRNSAPVSIARHTVVLCKRPCFALLPSSLSITPDPQPSFCRRGYTVAWLLLSEACLHVITCVSNGPKIGNHLGSNKSRMTHRDVSKTFPCESMTMQKKAERTRASFLSETLDIE